MKKLLVLLPLLALLTGCSLLPKKTEFFQRKVRAFPEVSESSKETQRKAAAYIAEKTEQAEVAAAVSNVGTNVTQNLSDADTVAKSLSGSLGPSERPWNGTAAGLAQKLDAQHADYNEDLRDYAKHIDKDAGKKIEGTGLVRIGYFTMWGIGLGVLFLLFAALKVYGMINPVVGAGTAVAQRVGGAILSRGIHEIVQGGESFKDYLTHSELTADVKEKVLDLFTRAHRENQSRDVQTLVSKITT